MWLTRLCSIAWRSGTVPLAWKNVLVVSLYKKGDRRVWDHTPQPPRESLCQGTGEESSADSRTSDSGGTVRSWNTGPALFPFQGAGGFMGVCPTNPHVFCGFGEGIRLCPSRRPVGGALGVWGPGPVAKGCPVPVRPEQELDSHCRLSFVTGSIHNFLWTEFLGAVKYRKT